MSSKEIDTFLKNLKILVLSDILNTKVQLMHTLPLSSPPVDQTQCRLVQSNKQTTNTSVKTTINTSVSTKMPNNQHLTSNTLEQPNLFKRPHNQISNLPKPLITTKSANCTITNVQSFTRPQQSIYQLTNSRVDMNNGKNISNEKDAPKKRKLHLRDTTISPMKNNTTVSIQNSEARTESNQSIRFEINELGDIVLYV